jgi:hypothetical protein
MRGAKYWDQIVKGYPILNTGEKSKGGITCERMKGAKVSRA